MKKFFVITLTICFSLVFALQSYGKENFEITLEKAGQLKKHIKKDDIKYVKSLILTGPVNNNDLELVAALENLEYLNLKKTDLNSDKYDSEKRSFYDGRTLRIPEFPYLKKFVGPKQHCHIAGLSKLPNLKTVYLLSGWNLAEDGFINTLDTLAVLSKGGRTSETDPDEFIARIADQPNYSMHYFEPEYLLRPIKTKFLYIDTPERFKEIIPNILITPSNTILYHWSSDLTEEDLMNIDYLAPYSYSDFNLAELTIPLKVKTLPYKLFGKYDSSKPKKIQNIDLKNVEDIEEQALNGCYIDKLILPSTLKYFHKEAFEKGWIDEAYFTSNSAPIMYDKKYGNGHYYPASYMGFNTMTKFVVPAGKMDRFRIGPWAYSNSHGNYTCLFEEGINSDFSFDIEKPGTLSDFITDEIAPYIENLTLSGVLYDTDFEVIKKCKNLRTLNLAKTFPCLSPETIAQKQMTAEALAGLFGLALEGAAQNSKSKFINGNGSFNEAAYYQALNENYKKMGNSGKNDPIDSDIKCQLPEEAFDGLHFLKKIVYPEILKDIKNGRISSPSIQEVILPPNLIELNAHIGGPRLISINIPASVKKIGFGVFSGCENLYEVDLRNTNVETIADNAFMNCPNIKNFYGSPVLKSIKGNGFSSDHWDKIETGWFYTKEMPDGLKHHCEFKTIHIPEGYTAAYSLYDTKIIDDIPN